MIDALGRSRLSRRVFGFLLVASVAISARAGDAVEKALPANTFVYLKVDNVKNLKDSFNASQMGQLWADQSMKPLKDKLAASLEEANTKAKEAIGVSLEELLDIPQGTLTVALVSKDDPKVPFVALISADAGDNATKMAEVLGRVDKIAEAQGAKVATEEGTGATFHVIHMAEEDAPPLIWTQVGNVFHLSTDLDALKDFLANAKGREDSLAASESFKQVAKKIDSDAHITWYADANQLINLAVRVAGENGVNGEEIAAQIQLTGLNGLKALGGSVALNQGDFDSVTKIYFYAPAPLQGVLKLFSMPPTDLKPELWVPSTVASYGTFSWEMDKFWGALTELVDQFAPGQLEAAEKALGENLDVKKDIFGPLGKRVSIISDYKKPITDTSQRAVIAVQLSDATGAQNTINKLIALAQADPKKRDFQGTTIYDFDLPAEFAGTGVTGPISIAIAKDYLFISTEPTLLEQILRGGGSSLADSAEFQAALKHIPAQVSMLNFDRPEDQVQVMYSMLTNDQFKMALSQIQEQSPEGPKLDEFLDPKLLPAAKEIQKYFAPSGGYGIASDDGFIMTSFTLKVPK